MVELFFMLQLDPLILYYISLLMFFNLEWAFSLIYILCKIIIAMEKLSLYVNF